MEEKEEEEYAVVPLNAPGIHDATDILAKYNRKDVHWDHVNDALKYDILLNGESLPSTTETSLRFEDLAEGDYCLQVKAISADTTLFYDSEWSSYNFTIDEDKIKGFKFDIDVEYLTSEYVGYRITPADLDATYDCSMIEKSLFDLYADMSDGIRRFVSIQRIEEMKKWWEMIIVTSGVRECPQVIIKPGVEYMIFAYGLKKDGTVTTSFQYTTFTSPSE